MLEQNKLYYVPFAEIERVRKESSLIDISSLALADILAQILRINILFMIKSAGSGHIGTSFSSVDIMLWLWMQEMYKPNQNDDNGADIFFSSKGHDAPALYAVLTALGKLPFNYIHRLRRLNGLPGHPDVNTPFIAANTGSLGTGISKAKGMALAKRLNGDRGRIFVLLGDGELQEGQIWESLQGAVNLKLGNIIAIVDHNKIQSDACIQETSPLGNIDDKFKSFGWLVIKADGHEFLSIAAALSACHEFKNTPKVIIANTIKGKGVSFMETPGKDNLYKFHSGSPCDKDYYQALEKLTERVNALLKKANMGVLRIISTDKPAQKTVSLNAENLVYAYGEELVNIGRQKKEIVVLDADLAKDCGLLRFKRDFPDRFVECGIAEQDMVSVAGGLALRGKLPIVHSFACFLSTRPNEQIYNNASEQTKIIYVGSLAGVLPAGPGHSHQSVRDISVLGSIPGLTMIQPCNELETRLALNWAIYKNPRSTYIRLASITLDLNYRLPPNYKMAKGCGIKIWNGATKWKNRVAIVAYGPVMLREAVKAALDIQADVFNFPWLNRVESHWIITTLGQYDLLVVIDDHYRIFGLGNLIAATFATNRIPYKTPDPDVLSLGLTEIPACGQNNEVLKSHKLDAKSIVEKVKENFIR